MDIVISRLICQMGALFSNSSNTFTSVTAICISQIISKLGNILHSRETHLPLFANSNNMIYIFGVTSAIVMYIKIVHVYMKMASEKPDLSDLCIIYEWVS